MSKCKVQLMDLCFQLDVLRFMISGDDQFFLMFRNFASLITVLTILTQTQYYTGIIPTHLTFAYTHIYLQIIYIAALKY